jgi:hypothetical protein
MPLLPDTPLLSGTPIKTNSMSAAQLTAYNLELGREYGDQVALARIGAPAGNAALTALAGFATTANFYNGALNR